jgi:hypothetical protein
MPADETRWKSRVDITSISSIEKWAIHLGVSENDLRAAISRVGSWIPAIEKHLGPTIGRHAAYTATPDARGGR